jgi:hypothetical protein
MKDLLDERALLAVYDPQVRPLMLCEHRATLTLAVLRIASSGDP